MLGTDYRSIIKLLSQIDLSQESVFIIEDLRTYYIIKCFLLKENVPFNDEFLPEKNSVENLYQNYLEDPSDENFLSVLSHPMCEQHDQFLTTERHFKFPRTSFNHFPLSFKFKFSEGSAVITLSKERVNYDLDGVNYYKFP
jgi:hypothetical protein